MGEFYYRGAQPKGEEYNQLASIGVKTIIDLRDDPKDYARELTEHAGMKYINFPMSDKEYPPSDTASKFLSLVNDKENWPVYVHCAGGRHRTGAMTAVFRMAVQGWDATRAFEQLIGAKSFEHAIEIQSQYAKKAYDTWVAEASKLGEMYAAVARDAYKPVEKAVAKRTA